MADSDKAVFRVQINGPIEEVWKEITRQDKPQACMFNSQLHTRELKPGEKMQMRTKSGKFVGVVGEILEFDPPRRYAHTFKFTNCDDPPCKVIYDLEQKDGGTQFTMTLEDLPAGTKTAKQMLQGGKLIVNTLKRVVETGKPALGVRLLFVLFRIMEPISPKSQRVENWPL
ncbi:SRPBCC domain-containing protein [bacterium]|nr:SRPBCC domain-containing protein [bacterium]